MPLFWSRDPDPVSPARIEIEVQVETQVEVDYTRSPVAGEEPGSGYEERPSLDYDSHGSVQPHTPFLPRRAVTAAPSDLYHPSPYLRPLDWKKCIMSLPRADYDPRRVCLNPCPNFTLGKHRRTIGVYLAGALVCFPRFRAAVALRCSMNVLLYILFSLRWRIGRSWMLLCCQPTQSPNGKMNRLFMLLSSIGCRGFAPC